MRHPGAAIDGSQWPETLLASYLLSPGTCGSSGCVSGCTEAREIMIPFRSNKDLFAFAEELLEFLRSTMEVDLADQLAHANRFISGSPAEFLNEVHVALRKVLLFKPKALSAEREDEIRQAIRQIDEVFRLTGGSDGIKEPTSDLDS